MDLSRLDAVNDFSNGNLEKKMQCFCMQNLGKTLGK